ncbi:protein of unknown function (plasmid) [Thermococcus nautili]|nr:protein of unknown function [Thermococcus nautili]
MANPQRKAIVKSKPTKERPNKSKINTKEKPA